MVPHMAQITLGGNPINTNGDLPAAGAAAPDFTLTKADWTPVSAADLAGQRVVMNIFPSLDTGPCQLTIRTFNERAADLENTAVLCVSADLPPAAARFCGAEGIENVITGSTFKNPEVLEALGVKMLDGKLQGLAARSVVVLDTDGTVLHSELVPEIASEPDYDAAIAAGALAGKVSGAGGGGFMMFFVDPARRPDVMRTLAEFNGQVFTCNFTESGAQSWRKA